MNRRFYWLKLPADFFRDKTIKRLRRIAGGDTYTVIYLKMLLQSMETGGKLYFTGIEEDIAEEIALEIDEDPENVKVTLQYLTKVGLAAVSDEDVFLENLPKMVGSEGASAQRVRKHREEQKLLQCNATVTDSNLLVTGSNDDVKKSNVEREKEKEIDKEKDIDIDKDIDSESVCTNNTHTTISVFIPPSLDEVIRYCKEHAPYVDPLRFYNNYASVGWKVNGYPMENWKARVKVWNREDKKKQGGI